MSPNPRQAIHRAVDLVLDAIADEMASEKPKRPRRGPSPVRIEPLDPATLPPHLRAQLDKHMARTGYRPKD